MPSLGCALEDRTYPKRGLTCSLKSRELRSEKMDTGSKHTLTATVAMAGHWASASQSQCQGRVALILAYFKLWDEGRGGLTNDWGPCEPGGVMQHLEASNSDHYRCPPILVSLCYRRRYRSIACLNTRSQRGLLIMKKLELSGMICIISSFWTS